jgi:flagellar motor switch protein FliG
MYEPVEGAVAKRDVDNARKKIVVNAKEMADSGAINLDDILSGGEMVE